LLLERACHFAETDNVSAALDDMLAAFDCIDLATMLGFLRDYRVSMLHTRLFPALDDEHVEHLLRARAPTPATAEARRQDVDDNSDTDDDDETASFSSALSLTDDGEAAAPPLATSASAGRAILAAEFREWRVALVQGAVPSERRQSRMMSKPPPPARNDGLCELLSSKFDPALYIAALGGRKHLSARHFVRFALERALVHDELEAERLALAIGVSRHANGKRSLVDVGALCDVLFAVKSVAFSNAPPYARKFRLRPGEFVIKSSSVRVAVPDDGTSRRAFAILSNSRLWIADESEQRHEIDVDTLLLAEAGLGRLDRVGEPMPQLVIYTLRSASPSLVVGFFAKAEVMPWCAALNELVVASRLQDELADSELSHKAAHRLVLIEGLHRMPRPAQASRLLFFQQFHNSRAGAIGNALHNVRMLNCTKPDERQQRQQ
jgi:hypothetical protein